MSLNDLNQMFSIVDPNTGKPTDYLMRLLRDRGIDVNNVEEAVQVLNDDVSLLDSIVQQINGTVIIAGTALSGGGTIGTTDPITIDLENTAVTPGAYTNPSITIDAQGRITSAANGTSGISGIGIEDEGTQILAAATRLNFTGSGVTVTDSGSGEAQVAIPGGGGSTGWSLVDQTGNPITSGQTWIHTTNVANVDVTGLGSYNELVIVARNLTSSASGNRNIVVSTNNGASFFTTLGDYVFVNTTGVEGNASTLIVHDTAATAARSLVGRIPFLKGPGPRLAEGTGSAANGNRLFVANNNNINAIRLLPGAGNLTGGSLFVYAR